VSFPTLSRRLALHETVTHAEAAAAWLATDAAIGRASAVDAAERAARSGLVSVPTTQTRGLASEIVLAELADARSARMRDAGAFAIDTEARRYSGLRMAVGFAARAHAVSEKGHRSDVPFMVTLTYAGTNADWRPNHLRDSLTTFRQWCKREGFACRYVWVAELQKRGVIHYHIAAWLPKGRAMPKWDKRGWWKHGMTNVIRAKHATAYLMAYLKKGDLADRGSLPKGARNYGVGGLDHSLRRARRWLRLPAFVQANSSIHDDWRRCVGGGWTSPAGEHYPSEFVRIFVAGTAALQRVHTHARSIDASGPFSWARPGLVQLH